MIRSFKQRHISQFLDRCFPIRLTLFKNVSTTFGSLPQANKGKIKKKNCKIFLKTKSIRQLYDFSGMEVNKMRRALHNLEIKKEVSVGETLKHLKELGFSKEDIWQNLEVVALPVNEIKSRIDYFVECGASGARMDKRIIQWFFKLVHKSIPALKAAGIFPISCDVPKAILSGIDSKMELPNLTIQECSNLAQVHWDLTVMYLEWVFGGSISDHDLVKLSQFIPFKNISSIITMLTKEADVPKRLILAHLDILNSDPGNLRRMLDHKEYPLKMDIHLLLQENPKVATYNFQNILKVLQVFENFSIPRDDVMRHTELLKESSSSVLENLATFHKLAFGHVKPLDVIHIHNFSLKAKLLNENNTQSELVRYVANTQKRLAKHLPHFLAKKLDLNIEFIRAALKKHPNWSHTKVASVTGNLNFLTSCGYSNKEIGKCLPLILYSSFVVSNTLTWIMQNETAIVSNPVNRDKLLPLCLYYIEKQNQFTWNVNYEDDFNISDLDIKLGQTSHIKLCH